MSDNPFVIEDLLAVLRRRKWQAGVPASIVLLLSVALASFLPPIYVSTATIMIEQQDISRNLVESTVTGYAAERVQMIRNRVMNNDNLWAIIERLNLYPDIRAPEDKQETLDRFRANVIEEMVNAETVDLRGRTINPTIAFTLSYGNESPTVAQSVTSELTELYLKEDRRSRSENAQLASAFLKGEAQRLQRQTSDLEEKIAVFKVKNAGLLPDSYGATSKSLETDQQELNQLGARMYSLQARHAFLKNRLAGFGPVAQLVEARLELAAAREIYSDIHPDVVRLRGKVAELEVKSKLPGSPTDYYSFASSDPEYLEAASELQQIAGNIKMIRSRGADLTQKTADYQSRLARSPEIEREYFAMKRDLDHATTNHRQIMDKVTSAQLAEKLERSQRGGERFTLGLPADYPTAPSKPNKPAIIVLGLTFALGVGIGIAALAEYLDHRIHGPKELAMAFNAPPIAVIPEIPS